MKEVISIVKKMISILLIVFYLYQLNLICNAENIIYHQVSTDNMQIALTFDDGPHPGRTPEILDILKQFNVKATFFVIGQNVKYYPDIFDRLISDGHEIGNHTFTHCSLENSSDDIIKKEFEDFEKIIAEHKCKKTCLFRPPGGLYNNFLRKYAEINNYDIILWSVDTMDWSHKSVDDIVNNILSNTNCGDIILMHDYISGKSPTPQALKKVIPILLERGYEFVTVSDLIHKSAR